MTSRPSRPELNNSYWGALNAALTVLAEAVPKLLEDRASSRQPREAILAFTSALAAETGPSPDAAASRAPLALTDALSLVATARALLDSAEGPEWPGGWCEEAGLEVHHDAVGNVWGILRGATPDKSIVSGSHIDTQRPGGRWHSN